ncbi:unnamed protein product [Arctogadus glacialis]
MADSSRVPSPFECKVEDEQVDRVFMCVHVRPCEGACPCDEKEGHHGELEKRGGLVERNCHTCLCRLFFFFFFSHKFLRFSSTTMAPPPPPRDMGTFILHPARIH